MSLEPPTTSSGGVGRLHLFANRSSWFDPPFASIAVASVPLLLSAPSAVKRPAPLLPSNAATKTAPPKRGRCARNRLRGYFVAATVWAPQAVFICPFSSVPDAFAAPVNVQVVPGAPAVRTMANWMSSPAIVPDRLPS